MIRAAAETMHWSQRRERGSALLLRLMAWIAVACGRRVARWCLTPITLYFLLLAPAARRHSARYLGRALGRAPRWHEIYRHLFTFAAVVLDRVYFARGQFQDFNIQIHGVEMIDGVVTEGHGAILLGAHLGSFEVLHALGAGRPKIRVAMAMYPENARQIHGVLQSIAPGFHLDIIAIGRAGATLEIRDWLAAGGCVGMLGDRFLAAESGRTGVVELPFLGQKAQFHDGPLRLAQLLRQRVVFMVGLHLGGAGYDVRFEPLADFREPGENAAERELELRRAMLAYVARIEALCVAMPYNWFNFHDFWLEDAPP
jgi:predicted LPLAT superfamily acyltransferase